MSKVAILLTDEFGEEVMVTPIKELPMKIVAKLSDIDGLSFSQQYETILNVLAEASSQDVADKFTELTSEQFLKFLERWFVA